MTDDGPIQGLVTASSKMTYYDGVPFAAAPTQQNRFRAAQRPAPWKNVLKTQKLGPQCPQLNIGGKVPFRLGEEDCLYMSVYVPERCTVESPCAVMQWIYGGAWIFGDDWEYSQYDPTTLAEEYGVVFVAGNYRLDTLGWLALTELEEESGGSYGNYGLTDQRAIMSWIQRNIRQFGGDPNKVTIWGQSAGGWSVCQHLVSPASNGLFTHAIMQSGDCDGPWMLNDGRHAKEWGDLIANNIMGCPPGEGRLQCLRELPYQDVVTSFNNSFTCPFNGNHSWNASNPWCNETDTGGWSRPRPPSLTLTLTLTLIGGWSHPRPPFAPIAGWGAVVDGSDQGLEFLPCLSF